MKFAILVIVAISLSGCVTTPQITYSKPGASEQDFKRDNYECMQSSKTSWSGGGSGLIGLAMIVGSSSAAQSSANKTHLMCMEARGYTPRAIQEGEKAATVRANDYCMQQLKAPGLALAGKTFFPPRAEAFPSMLIDDSKATPEQKRSLLDWGNARQKCLDKQNQEMTAVNYPQQLLELGKAATISGSASIVRLYRGEVTWGEFNLARNKLNAEYRKELADVRTLLVQATPEAVQRANQIVSDQQQASAENLRAVATPQSVQVGCENLQLGNVAFSNCN